MAYELKYRQRTVEYRKEGHTLEETSKVFKVSTPTIKKWEKMYDESGDIRDKPPKRTFKKINPVSLEEYMEQYPDAYLSEIAKVFACSEEAVRKALKRLKITRKKR